jgi:xylan 1,4-beta-xylosidase
MREGGQAWPTEEQWQRLREADRLDELEPARRVTTDRDGRVSVTFDLPMPAMSGLRLTPLA